MPLLPVNGQCIRYKSRYSAWRSLIVCWQASLTRPWSGLFSLLVIHTSFLDILPSLKMLPKASPTIFSFPYAAAQSMCLHACIDQFGRQIARQETKPDFLLPIRYFHRPQRHHRNDHSNDSIVQRNTCSQPSRPSPPPSRPGLPRPSMFQGLPVGF